MNFMKSILLLSLFYCLSRLSSTLSRLLSPEIYSFHLAPSLRNSETLLDFPPRNSAAIFDDKEILLQISKMTESPRKKVLMEKNEPARISFSSTEGKSPIRKVNSVDSVERKKFQPFSIQKETEKRTSSMVSESLKAKFLRSRNETEPAFQTVNDKPGCVNLDPSFKFSPTPPPVSSNSTIIAPHDAEPIPRYDPTLNYLSPRPQFLYYEPNPRVKLHKERECMTLDSVERKKSQPFSDGTIKKETEKHTSSMVSRGLKSEGKRPIRKVTFADFVDVKMFQPCSDGVVEEETEKHSAFMVSEDLKSKFLRSKNETEPAFQTVNGKPGCVNLDPSFKLSPTPPPVSSNSTIIAPHDAEPIPRYDPTLNYLSPRPQFLYYEPNPRVKLHKERECMTLDSVERKKSQPFSDGTIKKETEKHTSSMVSKGLKSEGKRPIRKATFADFVDVKMFQPFSDGVVEEETEKHSAFMVSEDLKSKFLRSKNETEPAFQTVNDKPGCVNLDPSFKLSPTPPPVSSNSTIIAPPEAEPIRRYDPTLNYLSPRSQFLYYKPNPRVKLHKERECMTLDSVERKKSQPFSDGTIKKEAKKHTSSMVSKGLKSEGKRPIRKVTFSDFVEVKMFQPCSDGVVEEETEKHTALTVSEDLKAKVLHSKNETESLFETVNDKPGCVNLDPSFKLSPTPSPVSSNSTIIAPPDADPIPPYDPILSYLSPRPQFLYYKPNPRVKLYKGRECRKLDDSFSDTELSQLTEEALPDGSEKESEVSSDEIVSEEKSHVSCEAKGVAKPGFSMRSKAIALFLVLSVACVSVSFTNSQVFDPLFKDLTILSPANDSSEFPRYARANFDLFSELAKENLYGLARNFHIWSSISELISTFRGVQNLGELHYWNLTGLQENIEVNHFPIIGLGEKLIGEAPQVETPTLIVEENDDFTETYNDEDIGDIPAEHYDSAYEEQEDQELEPVPPIPQIVDDNDAAKKIDTCEVGIAEVESASSASESEEASEPNHSEGDIDYPDIVSETCENNTEEFEANNFEAKQAPEKGANVIMDLKDKPDLNFEVAEIIEIHTDDLPYLNSEVAEITEVHTDGQLDLNSEIHTQVYRDIQLKLEEKYLSVESVIVASVLLFLSKIAGTAFRWFRKKDKGRRAMATGTNSMERPPLARTLHVNHREEASLEKSSLRNGPVEMDVLVESCPSEMGTFQKSSFYYAQRVMEEQNEAQSLEKKPKKTHRRESLASSESMGVFASYGSFTTCVKLSSKHGHGDAGIVTLVRRSSRIKHLATSRK